MVERMEPVKVTLSEIRRKKQSEKNEIWRSVVRRDRVLKVNQSKSSGSSEEKIGWINNGLGKQSLEPGMGQIKKAKFETQMKGGPHHLWARTNIHLEKERTLITTIVVQDLLSKPEKTKT